MCDDANDMRNEEGAARGDPGPPRRGSSHPSIAIYDIDSIAEAIGVRDRQFVLLGQETLQLQSIEEMAWAETLQRIADDPRGPNRRALVADEAMLQRLARAVETSPHFVAATGILERAMHLSIATGQRFRFPPLLLLGANGIGKTHYAGLVSTALNTSSVRVALNLISDRGRLAGSSLNWRGSRMGELARGLLRSETSSPLFVLDEIDKVPDLIAGGRATDVLVSALEEENAKAFVDEYLTVPMRLDHALWIMTANKLDTIPTAVLDLLLIIRVDDTAEGHATIVTESIFQDAIAVYGEFFAQRIAPDVLAHLGPLDKRRIRRLLDLALGFVFQDQRRKISLSDIRRAEELDTLSSRRAAGFV